VLLILIPPSNKYHRLKIAEGHLTMSAFRVSYLILAVLPLCIRALEHQITEMKLPGHRRRLSDSLYQLSMLHPIIIDFVKTTHELCKNISLPNPEHFDREVNNSNAKLWQINKLDQRLLRYLGTEFYDTYKLRIDLIWSNIATIAGILGLDDFNSYRVRKSSF